mmetsp:Transcript_16906/g.27304  ORF Transcript_16906/g.27304 Transcript_16906/m.27304 type:complete len:194 (-) Transcript_16906:410-991(-)
MDHQFTPRLSPLSMASITVLAAVSFVVVSCGSCAEAYVSSSSLRRSSTGKIRYSPTIKKARGGGVHKRREDGSAVTLYLFPTPPSVSVVNHRRQSRSRATRPNSPRQSSTALPAMSPSVLAASDTLPSFQTAHGLLSPEVVMRIADGANDMEEGEPLHRFLKLYKSRGPMACLPMLSDPSVLPELTKAMREIA